MIIISGSTGFIGRRMVPLLCKYYPSEKIVCLVNKNLNAWEQQGKKIIQKLKVKIIDCDILEPSSLTKLPRSAHIVIHLAATTDTSQSNYSANDIGTKKLYKSLGKLGPKNHIIFTSTTALMAGRHNCSMPFDETSTPNPTNNYGRSKLNAEKYLIEKCIKDKFKLTIVRLTTVYGDDPRKNSLFDIMKVLILKKSLLARLNWPGLTGLIHVNDVALGILALSKQPPTPGIPRIFILNTELLTLSQISQSIHHSLKIRYSPINLPKLAWKILAALRRVVFLFENLLPTKIYNHLWRTSILVDNVIYCNNNRIKQILPKNKLHYLKNNTN